MSSNLKVARWGGAAFVLGNLLFIVNKINEMSRLFLLRWMPDVISGENPLLILLGQALLVFGYVSIYRFYARLAGRFGRIALGLFSIGGILLAVGHVGFINVDWIPSGADYLFIFVLLGLLLMLVGLISFGVINLRQPVVSRWQWLPLATGVLGFVGFFLFSGEEITAVFLVFRTLFALGLIGLGLVLWMEKPEQVIKA